MVDEMAAFFHERNAYQFYITEDLCAIKCALKNASESFASRLGKQ